MKKNKITDIDFNYTTRHAKTQDSAKLPKIACWQNQYKNNYEINISYPEFSSVCPKTGLPDCGEIVIIYTPDKLCLELKSLKYYMLEYRDMGIFMENIANKILKDVVSACKPKKAKIIANFAPRGGLKSLIVAEYKK
jgi:7-cyano-7-deazaguanine reductase